MGNFKHLQNRKKNNETRDIIITHIQQLLSILGPLHFYMNFRVSLSPLTRKPAGILIRIVLNL